MDVELVPPELLDKPNSGDSWNHLVPHVWRIVADPEGSHLWTQRPTADRGDPYAWWTPPLHLMLFGLGWADAGLGLHRWKAAGRPTDSPILAALDALWGDHLVELQSWFETSPAARQLHQHLADVTATAPIVRTEPPNPLDPLDPVYGLPSPFGGGTDPLHLAAHCSEAMEIGPASGPPVQHEERWVRQRDRLTAAMLARRYAGWVQALHASDPLLGTAPSARSWRVDVVVEPVGWLGTYRRSRTTGRWFTGRHRHHLMGWPTASQSQLGLMSAP